MPDDLVPDHTVGAPPRSRGTSSRPCDICRFRAADDLADETVLPATLGEAPDLHGVAATAERSFVLASDQINGRSMAMDRIDFGVRVGTVEVWEVTNT
ncbi:hypothetical protein ACO229_09470 [Promicromonospora sp. MS192]|uniref:hypothetical protein n=1 Tax=Promicromonospora sp. MS192 TaxID=3412684 RepID=UPI003C2F310C